MVRCHASDGDVCRAISKLRELLWSVAYVINNVSPVCLSKCAWKTVYLQHYYIIFSFVYFVSSVIYATGCLMNKDIHRSES